MNDKHYKIPELQDLLNVYPEWSSVRNDHQSLGAQVLNSLGLAIEDLRWQMTRELYNNWLPQYICMHLDEISEIDINDFELQYTTDHPGEMVLQPPTCSGLQNGTWYEVEFADPNSLESLYFDFIPTRVTQNEVVSSGEYVIIDSGIFSISSGVAAYNYWEDLEHDLPFPNRVYVEIENGQLFYTTADNTQCTVKLTGKNRSGVDIEEELLFAFNDRRRTNSVFSRIDSVHITGLKINDMDQEESDPANIRVVSALFGNQYLPIGDPNHIVYSQDRERGIRKFGLANSGVLEEYHYVVPSAGILQSGYGELEIVSKTKLLDTVGSGVDIDDIAILHGMQWIFAVSSGENKLYCYDVRDIPWPDFGQLKYKKYDALCKIETTSDIIAPGESVTISTILERREVEPAKARLAHTTPSGTTYMITPDGETTFDSNKWFYREEQREADPSGMTIIPAIDLTLTEAGEHIFTLTLVYSDGTEEVDQRIVIVSALSAAKEYDVSGIVQSGEIIGIDFDIDGALWAATNSGVYYKFQMHNDRFIIDDDNMYAYFFEDYDSVKMEY